MGAIEKLRDEAMDKNDGVQVGLCAVALGERRYVTIRGRRYGRRMALEACLRAIRAGQG